MSEIVELKKQMEEMTRKMETLNAKLEKLIDSKEVKEPVKEVKEPVKEMKKPFLLSMFPHSPYVAPKPTILPTITANYTHYKYCSETLPAGRYYIGDLCYSLKEEIYEKVLGGNGYATGYYETEGGLFMLDHTAYGDGSYESEVLDTSKRFEVVKGFKYGVDAGIIGIASMNLCVPEEKVYGGTLHTFEEPVECSFKNGYFEFRSGKWSLTIDTAGSDDSDKDDDYE